MAPPRIVDYELVKQLIQEHREWPYSRYADVLTEDSRSKGLIGPRDRIKPDSVRRIVSQYRDEWQEEGVQVPVRGVVHADLLPPLGAMAPSQRMTTPLRYLREISKERRGEKPYTDSEAAIRHQALKWAARLRENREIVDVSEGGIVEVRPARRNELDGAGNLVDLAAWAVPGYEWQHRRGSGRGR